jgi:hypothetical protein
MAIVMTTKSPRSLPLHDKNVGTTNQIQAYKNNSLVVGPSINASAKLPLPDYDILLEITRLSSQIVFEQKTLEQKQLTLQITKEQYRQKLLNEEQDIRTRVITIKKRQNIAQMVESIRQSELELQNKLQDRMDKYKPTQKLNKNQKYNLFIALMNKVTDAN